MTVAEQQTYAFQADISQLMSLIVNAFYSNRDIFLRELISNSSDALDKLRHKVLSAGGAIEGEPAIRISADPAARTLTIEDDGVGMTEEELRLNLGTIASSGTKRFMESLREAGADLSLIGKFGVGFYSSYLVADRVRVVTRAHGGAEGGASGAAGYVWESAGSDGTYSIREATGADWGASGASVSSGTRVVLFLKADAAEYLETKKVAEVIEKHSTYILYPIKQSVVKETTENNITVSSTEWEQLNKKKPIWLRAPSEVTKEEYEQFYKSISYDWDAPAGYKHFSVEGGEVSFRGLLFVPRRPPFDPAVNSTKGSGDRRNHNIKLYCNRVFITDNSEEMIPNYLNFVRGVVDSDQLSLNVSREILQQTRAIQTIRKGLTRRALDTIADLDEDTYKVFYQSFSENIKLGICQDDEHRERLFDLLRFYTSKSDGVQLPLRDYVARMPEGQKRIYYITAGSLTEAMNSPCIERLRKRGYEVLYMTDTIDEYMIQRLPAYKDHPFQNVAKEGALLEDDEEAPVEKKALCDAIREVLGSRVLRVVVSSRLADSPAIMVGSNYGWTANMTRIMRAQAMMNNQIPRTPTTENIIMEINPEHPVIRKIEGMLELSGGNSAGIRNIATMLYYTAMLASGFPLDENSAFVGMVYRLIAAGFSLDEAAILPTPAAGASEGSGSEGSEEPIVSVQGGKVVGAMEDVD